MLEAPMPALPSLGLPAWPGSTATLPAAAQRLDTAAGATAPPATTPRAELPSHAGLPWHQQQEQQQAAGSGASGGLQLESIFIYPIKSCRGMQADAWPLGECWAAQRGVLPTVAATAAGRLVVKVHLLC